MKTENILGMMPVKYAVIVLVCIFIIFAIGNIIISARLKKYDFDNDEDYMNKKKRVKKSFFDK